MSAVARPRVVAVVDRPGWAHDRKTDAIARALAERYEIVKAFQSDVTSDDLDRADVVLFYYWLQIERLPRLREKLEAMRSRLLVGVCSHHELSGAWREPGLALLDDLPRAVFVNNKKLLDELAPLLRVPLHYTPNGVDTEHFRPGDTTQGHQPMRVGWAGSLANQGSEHRGVREVIAPAAAAAGAELRLAAREERWRNADEMVEFYGSIDVYVCASHTEGTPNPCLEAAACGLPLVTTAVGNMPEFIRDGENGFLVERTVEAMADRLTALRDDAGMRVRMGAAARATAERWDWRQQALPYASLFDQVLRNADTL